MALKYINFFQGLHNLSFYRSRGVGMVRWSSTTVFGTSVKFLKSADSHTLSEVDMSSYGGYRFVKSVRGVSQAMLKSRKLTGSNVKPVLDCKDRVSI